MKKHYRQGDILLVETEVEDVTKLEKVPKEENGDVILAHGEATGHAHRIKRKHNCDLYASPLDKTSPQGRVLHARKLLAKLDHEEHSSATLDAEFYETYRQVEYQRKAPLRVVAD